LRPARRAQHPAPHLVPRQNQKPQPRAGGRVTQSLTTPTSRPSRLPLVAPGHTSATVTDQISAVVLAKTPKWWFPAFAVAFALLNLFLVSVGWLFLKGIGIWGINMPVAWGWDIVNFVWWVGIGHAGTLISAVL